jgi:Transglutaminase-like superfamily
MGSILFDEVPLAARAVATRLRLASLVRGSSLPDLLRALAPDRVEAAPLAVVEHALAASQQIVARLRVVPDTCLYRSLARYALLRRAGHPARFMMGLDPRAADIVGHAWVELDGAPFGEEVEPALAVTFAYPPP